MSKSKKRSKFRGPRVRPERDPAYKALATKGYTDVKRLELSQYYHLLELGVDGEVCMAWTQGHAQKEIERREKRLE